MTGPDCAVMCYLINKHTHRHCIADWAINRYGFQSCSWLVEHETLFSPLSLFAPEKLASRDGFGRPAPRQPPHSPIIYSMFVCMYCCCCCCFSHSAHWLPTRKKQKTTLHGGQSRSWSAEQGKKKKSGSAPPPPPARALLVRRKNKNNKKLENHAAHPHV